MDRRRLRIVGWIALAVVVLGLAGTVGGFYAAGYRPYIIHTGSMTPELVPGDLVIDRPADDHYRVGDVITFRHGPTDDLVTHRIIRISSAGIHTKGDANRTADVWTIPRSYVEGVASWHVPGAGYAIVFLRQPTGFAAVVLSIIGLILLWHLFFPDGTESQSTEAAPVDASPDDPAEPPAPPDAPPSDDPVVAEVSPMEIPDERSPRAVLESLGI